MKKDGLAEKDLEERTKEKKKIQRKNLRTFGQRSPVKRGGTAYERSEEVGRGAREGRDFLRRRAAEKYFFGRYH